MILIYCLEFDIFFLCLYVPSLQKAEMMTEIVCLSFVELGIFSHSIVENALLLCLVPFVLFALYQKLFVSLLLERRGSRKSRYTPSFGLLA